MLPPEPDKRIILILPETDIFTLLLPFETNKRK